jgi:hypothetical protein
MRIKLLDHVDISHLVKRQQRCQQKAKGRKLEKLCLQRLQRFRYLWKRCSQIARNDSKESSAPEEKTEKGPSSSSFNKNIQGSTSSVYIPVL